MKQELIIFFCGILSLSIFLIVLKYREKKYKEKIKTFKKLEQKIYQVADSHDKTNFADLIFELRKNIK